MKELIKDNILLIVSILLGISFLINLYLGIFRHLAYNEGVADAQFNRGVQIGITNTVNTVFNAIDSEKGFIELIRKEDGQDRTIKLIESEQ